MSRPLEGSAPTISKQLLEVRELTKFYSSPKSLLSSRKQHCVLDSVSFSLDFGARVALVGKSGSGKTTLARCILGLSTPSDGQIFYQGIALSSLSRRRFRSFRKNIQMVFQSAAAALNPRQRLRNMLEEALDFHQCLNSKQRHTHIEEIVKQLDLPPDSLERFPHEISGGQKQRFQLARALCVKPELLLLDEPVSSLDMHARKQVIGLFKQVQQHYALSFLLISHDLRVVAALCQSVMVMLQGSIVEIGTVADILQQAQHPYTQQLVSAARLRDQPKDLIQPTNQTTDELTPRTGCLYVNGCSLCQDICLREKPKLKALSDSHSVACHIVDYE